MGLADLTTTFLGIIGGFGVSFYFFRIQQKNDLSHIIQLLANQSNDISSIKNSASSDEAMKVFKAAQEIKSSFKILHEKIGDLPDRIRLNSLQHNQEMVDRIRDEISKSLALSTRDIGHRFQKEIAPLIPQTEDRAFLLNSLLRFAVDHKISDRERVVRIVADESSKAAKAGNDASRGAFADLESTAERVITQVESMQIPQDKLAPIQLPGPVLSK